MIPKRVLLALVILAFMVTIAMYNIKITISKASSAENKIVKVAAGGGNVTAPWTDD